MPRTKVVPTRMTKEQIAEMKQKKQAYGIEADAEYLRFASEKLPMPE